MLRIREAMLNAAALCLVLAGMVVISADVRRHVMNLVAGDRAGELAMIASPVSHLMRTLLETVSSYQGAHTPLVAFGIAAVVLVGFMLRS